jgi:alkylation response protein AidB-like acyl-CoA dehydrogenase
MNFLPLPIEPERARFWSEVREYIGQNVTQLAPWDDPNGLDRPLQKALGRRGWLLPTWPVDQGGAGLDSVAARIIENECDRIHANVSFPGLILNAVLAYGSEELKAEVLPGIAAGDLIFCLGYTEPDTGSDLAAVSTRSARDGDDWVVNGAKMFTTRAPHSTHIFLLTRSDPNASKHQGLTTFLCPLSLEGIEIRPIETFGEEGTNLVFFNDVKIFDRFRLGSPGQGWRVVSGPLAEEHGVVTTDPEHLAPINGAMGARFVLDLESLLEEAVDWAAEAERTDDKVLMRLLAELDLATEVTRNTPGAMGRINSSESLIKFSADLTDAIGWEALLPRGTPGSIGEGVIERSHRHAPGSAIYGGTTDIYRNIVARELGLPISARKTK